MGWPTGIEPVLEVPQTSVLTVTLWPPYNIGALGSLFIELLLAWLEKLMKAYNEIATGTRGDYTSILP